MDPNGSKGPGRGDRPPLPLLLLLLLRSAAAKGIQRALSQVWTCSRVLLRRRLSACWRQGHELRNELVSLRAIQSLAVLDVRNYRALVYELGDYAADGVDSREAYALP